jgi:hypothetical protein
VLSVSMSVVLRSVKKVQVNTAFRGSLTAADVGTDLVDFLAVCEVLRVSEIYLLHMLPGSRHPGPSI